MRKTCILSVLEGSCFNPLKYSTQIFQNTISISASLFFYILLCKDFPCPPPPLMLNMNMITWYDDWNVVQFFLIEYYDEEK